MLKSPCALRKQVVHSIHGEDRPDDYHWLKTQGKEDQEVLDYLTAENQYLDGVLGNHQALKEELYQDLLSHVQEEDEAPPIQQGDWLYYTRSEAGKSLKIYMRRPVSGGEAVTLLDLNELKEKEQLENIWIYETKASPDGRYWAYLMDTTGQEFLELRVLDTTTGELAETPLTQLSGWVLDWYTDNQHLIYSTQDEAQRPDKIWRHQLGTDRDQDTLLFHETDATFRVAAHLTENQQTLFIHSQANKADEWRFVSAADAKAMPTLLLPREREIEVPILTDADTHWLAMTNQGGASEFKLVIWPKTQMPLTWDQTSEVIPYDANRHLEKIHLFKNHLLLAGRENGLTQMWVLPRSEDGFKEPQQVKFSEDSYFVTIWENHVYNTDQVNIAYTSLICPVEYRKLDLNKLETQLIKATPVLNYDANQYVSEQMWATAPDGERIPISLVRRKDTELPAPTLLYAYGSYGYSTHPQFFAQRLPLLDRGWVWAIAHIRGGSEMGRRWYDAGRLEHKMNSFTDFIAAGEHLKQAGVATELTAMGGSAGGLLMGAVVNLRPDLWKTALVMVPFVDVLSTMLDDTLPLTTNEYDEWGNPNEPAAYATMREYSPYDNLKETVYPNLFVSTGLNDPRVAYWEPAKYAARVRTLAQEGSGTVVLKTIMGAGHGGSSGRYEILREDAELYAFTLAALKDEL